MKLDRIFEPQVVSQPSAQKMSFWARGTPVSAVPSPFAIRASAALACASERSGSTVMKALRSRCRFIRSRNSRVSSTLEISLRLRARASSATVLSNMGFLTGRARKLLYYLGDQVQPGLDRRGDFLEFLALVGLGDRVLAQPQAGLVGMGHGRHGRGIHGVHLLDQSEDAGQRAGVGVRLRFGDVQARQMRYSAYLFTVQGHAISLMGQEENARYHIRPAG